MRLFLCVSIVFLFATHAAAQVNKNSPLRSSARSTDTNPRKGTEKGRLERGSNATDQASPELDLANALLAIMDTDGDGVVTKAEMTRAMTSLRKVRKDTKGNMVVAEKPVDPGAAVAGGEQGQIGAGTQGPAGPGGGRGNEAMARFMQYDRNRDGKLTVDEVPAQGRAMLQGADLNNDGAIDASELQALAARMGDRMKAWAGGVDPNAAAGAPGTGVPGDGRGRKLPPRNENK